MKKYIIGVLMMFSSINIVSAAVDSTAVKNDELPMSAISISDDTTMDIEDVPSDTVSTLQARITSPTCGKTKSSL